MKLEEVMPALRAGKVLVLRDDIGVTYVRSFEDVRKIQPLWLASDGWSFVEEPATDEELAAAFEARAEQIWRKHGVDGPGTEYDSLYEAADMVRKRYVDPSWKPADKVGK